MTIKNKTIVSNKNINKIKYKKNVSKIQHLIRIFRCAVNLKFRLELKKKSKFDSLRD